MAHIILFHHAQGLTDGLRRLGLALESAGHTVTMPDMYEGKTFPTVDTGVAHAEELTFDTVFARADEALTTADALPATESRVYVGFSMGAVPATTHALANPDAAGLILMHAAVDPDWFPVPWPAGLPVQVHACDADPWMEFDALDSLRAATADTTPVQVHLYPGESHLFSDDSVPDYNEDYARTALERILRLLNDLS